MKVKLKSSRPKGIDVDVSINNQLWLAGHSHLVQVKLASGNLVELSAEAVFQDFNDDKPRVQLEFEVFSSIAVMILNECVVVYRLCNVSITLIFFKLPPICLSIILSITLSVCLSLYLFQTYTYLSI